MITANAFDQAQPLVEILNAKDYCIAPVEGTPLYALVAASNPPITSAEAVPSNGEYSSSMYSSTQASAGTDNENHNRLFDDTVDFLSKTIIQHVSNAKNIVSPVVLSVAEKIIARTQSDIQPLKTYCIVPVSLPEPMLNDGFKQSVEKANGGVYGEPERYLTIDAEFAPQAFLDMMLTGSNEYDDKIRTWFASCGDSLFNKLWTGLFQKPNETTNACNLISVFEDNKTGVDAALTVFLITRKMIDAIPENTGMTLNDFKKYALQYKDAAAVRLNRAYESRESENKAGILVITSDDISKEVRVNSDTYLTFINNGGKNEVILGAVVSGVIPYNVKTLEENSQQYIDSWERHKLIIGAASKNSAVVKFRDICYSEFLAELNNLSAMEQEYIVTNPAHIQNVQESAKKMCSDLTAEKMDKPYDVALALVCRCRFYYTDSEKILSTIDSISKENPTIDVREAALISTTQYLIDYICEQTKVV